MHPPLIQFKVLTPVPSALWWNKFDLNFSSSPFAGVNECQGDKHGCSQNCVDMKIGYKCGCKKGFILAHDNRTCHGKCFNTNLLIN